MSEWHPYRDAPSSSFWSSFVRCGFDTRSLVPERPARLRPGARVVSAGSCFAANLVPHLERHGLIYVREEYQEALFGDIRREALSYAAFSAGYGNVYTTRQLLQLVLRSMGEFVPREDRWVEHDRVIDPFRLGLRYFARSEREFEVLTQQHLRATRRAFEAAELFVFTLGLTEAWVSTLDGAVFPACPGTVAGVFEATRHRFVNFTAQEVRDDLARAIAALRRINPHLEVVLTVSPVPLVATAGGGHVLPANTYSKSVLRVAAEEVVRSSERVYYFPAYEIITGPQAPRDYLEEDRRSVSQAGIEAVMTAFFAGLDAAAAPAPRPTLARDAALHSLSRQVVAVECEEAFADLAAPTSPDACG